VVPEPSNLDDVEKDPNMRGAVAVLVSVESETDKTVRINITARESQLEAIDRLARKAGMTRSAYVVQSALNRFPSKSAKARQRTASRRGNRTRAKR
ncbi:MAG TPA: type II toxin-antitoxin system HicB family antitoxin, partial [Candidatus Binatus sp.]|nr:type II toxin-antitoxin system HicB family antitoxin [Candidatus Binatus sp.]